MSVNHVFLAGLGSSPSGGLDGYRPFGDAMEEKYETPFTAFSYADPDLIPKIIALGPNTIITGHSNGSAEFLTNVDPAIVKNGGTIRAYCSLDAKPVVNNPLDWITWAFKRSYRLPNSTFNVWSFHGNFGIGFTAKELDTYLDIPHAAFPGNVVCQRWIENAIIEASK